MTTPYEKLAGAYQNEKRVTVRETDGTVHEERIVDDFTRARTATFEIWQFVLRAPYGETTLFWTDLEAVDVLGEATDEDE